MTGKQREPNPQTAPNPSELEFFCNAGEVSQLMRTRTWEDESIGQAQAWPSTIRVLVSLMLASSQPMFLVWGQNRSWFYNDAFIPILGRKHPVALGQPSEKVWSEAWAVLASLFARVFAGESIYMADIGLQLDRNGQPQEAHFAFSYNPVRGASGEVVALFGTCIETTEQVLAIRRAEQSEERLHLALSAGDGIGTWDWDIPSDRVVADARFARLFGVDPDVAAVGAPIAEFFKNIHPEDLPRTRELIEEAMRVGGNFHSEYRLLQRDGSVRWVSAQGRCVLDERGQRSRFPGVGFEITARKVAEQELRDLNNDLERQVTEQTRERTRTWEVSPEMMGILNTAGYFEKSNPAWEKVLGWSETEIRSTRFLEFIHPEDIARTETVWAAAAQGTPALRFENRYRRKAGGWTWLSWIVVAEATKIYCTARDVTAERDRADALHAVTVERERLWDTSPDLLVVLDFQGTILRVNPAWTRILGYEPPELLGRPVSALVIPEDRPALRRSLDLARAGELPEVEHRLCHKEGPTRWFSWVASPAEEHIYATGRHITTAKEATIALAKAEEALRQAQKMEAVGQLTGGIAHDFNNLLASVSTSMALLKIRIGEGRVEGLDRYIEAAQSASRRGAALTQRLLAFARQQTLDPKPIDVNRLIQGMEDLLRRSVGPAVHIEVVGAGGLWKTKVDAPQLENSLLNLCINARDAMAPDGGRITIETANRWFDERGATEHDVVAGQYISICVTDTGTGMPPEVVSKIFDPFFTTKPLGQGTGLGLSMVYGFIRQSSGQIRVYSEAGKGTTMCLYLPRYFGSEASEVRKPEPTVDPGAGETILVIDDEESIRMFASEVLENNGYSVLQAADGPGGLAILSSGVRIDLLVTDVGLPGGLNGRQVADGAREKRPDLKVLFMTGYAENAVFGNRVLESGMAIITKPFDLAQFANKVRQLIDCGITKPE